MTPVLSRRFTGMPPQRANRRRERPDEERVLGDEAERDGREPLRGEADREVPVRRVRVEHDHAARRHRLARARRASRAPTANARGAHAGVPIARRCAAIDVRRRGEGSRSRASESSKRVALESRHARPRRTHRRRPAADAMHALRLCGLRAVRATRSPRDRRDINRCPPGGDAVVAALAALTGRAAKPIDPACGTPGPRLVAVIDESACIGCTLCIEACPVDAIIGAQKRMHAILPTLCSGCELCVAPCPVDCIDDGSAQPRVDARGRGRRARAPPHAQRARRARRAHRQSQSRRGRAVVRAREAAGRRRRGAGARPRAASGVQCVMRACRCSPCTLLISNAMAADTPDFSAQLDKLWNFGKPAESQVRFREPSSRSYPAGSREALEIETQIARTRRPAAQVRRRATRRSTRCCPSSTTAPARVKVRYLLERGRTRNSSGDRPAAVALFQEALAARPSATRCRAPTSTASTRCTCWASRRPPPSSSTGTCKALAAAESASEERARGWAASLHNNIGWTYFDRGDAEDRARALAEGARRCARRRATPARIRIAKWTIARGYRARGPARRRAERSSSRSSAETERAGAPDGYVYEELAEIAMARATPRPRNRGPPRRTRCSRTTRT